MHRRFFRALFAIWQRGWLCLAAASCVSREPVELPPHLNLSPEEVDLRPDPGSHPAPERPYLGLQAAANESDSLERLERLPGLRVAQVDPGGPADRCGIRAGDIILAAAGEELEDPEALEFLAARAALGVLKLELRRDTVAFEAELKPQFRDAGGQTPVEIYRVDPIASRAGYSTTALPWRGGEARGARIHRLFPKSPLPGAGLRIGDAVTAIDGVEIRSAQDLVNRLVEAQKGGGWVELTVLRAAVGEPSGYGERRIGVQLWKPETRITSLALLPLFSYKHVARRSETRFSLLDLGLLALFSYQRSGPEVEYRILFWIRFGWGEGELSEEPDQTAGEEEAR